ncbi:MAG: prolipoprotein diacylglyceryl transferase [Candidatus Falkowbacteria bacterium]|nr:prolipoprotein diacylglyceryl transferase [Candidatus Falkowbacteria bacterium]
MVNLLHTFVPQAMLWSWGYFHIYWYGFFIVLAISLALLVTSQLANLYQLKKELILDLSFWLIIGGLIGARIYEVGLEFSYYSQNPLDILKVWQGGLAIHGAIIAGLIIVAIFSSKQKINFWILTAVIVPGLALGQAVGRWGNYFNQELFGLPTRLPWGIPIDIINRPLEYIGQKFFQPTFLYESLGDLLIFLILLTIHVIILKRQRQAKVAGLSPKTSLKITVLYLILYSTVRFFLEFIKVDSTPTLASWRWPQIISLIIIALSIILLAFKNHGKKTEKNQ